jgi:hypothetical protein
MGLRGSLGRQLIICLQGQFELIVQTLLAIQLAHAKTFRPDLLRASQGQFKPIVQTLPEIQLAHAKA